MSKDEGIIYRWMTEEDLNAKIRAAVVSALDTAISEINTLDGHVYDETTIRKAIEEQELAVE